MDKDKIINLLNIIGFKFGIHDSIKTAIKETLDSDIYAPVMKGIVTDQKRLNEVRNIIESYNELKEIDQELIDDTINSITNTKEDIIEEEYDDSIKEIIIDDTDSNNIVIRVKDELGNYQVRDTYFKHSFKQNGYTYSINSIGTYDLLGNKISDIDNSTKITDNIYLFKDNDVIYFKSLDGRTINIDDNNKNLIKILDNSDISMSIKEQVFNNYLINGLNYLSYTIKNIYGNYLYCAKDKEVCYFDVLGNLIISTEDNYPFIDEPNYKREDESHIIIIGDYNQRFEMVYGYYDLDKRIAIQKPAFKKAYPWASYITTAMDGSNKVKIYKRVNDILEPIGRGFKDNISYYNTKDVIELSDNIYMVKFEYFDNNPGYYDYESAIIKDLLTKPKIILTKHGRYYNHHSNDLEEIRNIYSDKHLNEVLADGYDHTLKVINIGDEDLEIKNITTDYLCKKYGNNQKQIEDKELSINTKSDFLLPIYKNNYLMNIPTSLSTEIEPYAISKVYKDKEELRQEEIEVSNIRYIDKINDSIYIKTNNDEYGKVLNPNNGKIISENRDIKVIDSLKDGSIIITAKYGEGTKKFVLDDNYNIVIGPVDDIKNCRYKDVLIITNKGKQQIYQNNLPISYPADSIKMIRKYYVNGSSMVKDVKYIFKIQNNGNTIVIDTNGDKVLEQSKETLDLMKQLSSIDNELLEDNARRKKK